ncbi:MAG TPA: hypothetical protein VJJ76_01110 [archaeon]|nr:hypothetical protein [archaeon]
MVLVGILAVVDILAGVFILFNAPWLAGYLAVLFLLKGLFSLISSFSVHYFFDWMGFVDVFAGITFTFIAVGWFFGFFTTLGWIVLLKGIYSLARYLLRF